MPRPTRGSLEALRLRGYHPLWPAFPDRSASLPRTTGLLPVRSPLLAESLLMSFPPGTEMFQFPGFASRPYGFRPGYPKRGGFPHSEIRGSTIARISPRLIAACHVLHRLLAPRHPPDALLLLHFQASGFGSPRPTPARRTYPPLRGQSGGPQHSLTEILRMPECLPPLARTASAPSSTPDPIHHAKHHQNTTHPAGYAERGFGRFTQAAKSRAGPLLSAGKLCLSPVFPTHLETVGSEPTAPCLQSRCSPTELRPATMLTPRLRAGAFGLLAPCAAENATAWAREDLNLRPHAYQACALTN